MKNNKIKLMHIMPELDLGGAERFLLELDKNLDKRVFDVRVACITYAGPLAQEFEKIGVKVKVTGKRFAMDPLMFINLYKYIKQEKPNIIHTQLFGADTWGRMLAKILKVPVIVSTEQNINIDEGLIKRTIKRILSKYTDKIVAITNAVKQYSVEKDKINPDKIMVIPNALDINKFYKPEARIFKNTVPTLGIVARLSEQKGHKYLLSALAQINFPFECLIIGNGPLKDNLIKQSANLGISQKIKFIGAKEDIKEYLDKIDIFILPSLWEGQGIVLLEAGLAGKFIIASNVGGIPEATKENCAILIPAKDIEALAEAINWTVNNKKEAQDMARANQTFIKENFDIKNIAKQYEDLFISLYHKKTN